jgi:hypothetical protein
VQEYGTDLLLELLGEADYDAALYATLIEATTVADFQRIWGGEGRAAA